MKQHFACSLWLSIKVIGLNPLSDIGGLQLTGWKTTSDALECWPSVQRKLRIYYLGKEFYRSLDVQDSGFVAFEEYTGDEDISVKENPIPHLRRALSSLSIDSSEIFSLIVP